LADQARPRWRKPMFWKKAQAPKATYQLKEGCPVDLDML
jgi:hypothetical protein